MNPEEEPGDDTRYELPPFRERFKTLQDIIDVSRPLAVVEGLREEPDNPWSL